MADDRLSAVLRALLPARMAEDIDAANRDGEFDAASVAEMLTKYLTADEETREDIASFHESDGESSDLEKLSAAANHFHVRGRGPNGVLLETCSRCGVTICCRLVDTSQIAEVFCTRERGHDGECRNSFWVTPPEVPYDVL